MKVTLYAPKEYWELEVNQKRKICNGCGAKGSKLNFLIPQGVFTEACNIHDYMYYTGKTDEDKKVADRVFINNLNRIVKASNPLLRPIRKAMARAYYEAVSKFGYEAFWKDKVYPGMSGREVEI